MSNPSEGYGASPPGGYPPPQGPPPQHLQPGPPQQFPLGPPPFSPDQQQFPPGPPSHFPPGAPPYGGAYPAQPPRKRRTLTWVVAGVVAVLVVVVGATAAVWTLNGGSDESKIDSAVHSYFDTMSNTSVDAAIKESCDSERNWWNALPELIRSGAEKNRAKVTVSAVKDIKIDGDQATAKVTAHNQVQKQDKDRVVPLHKESGTWRVCATTTLN